MGLLPGDQRPALAQNGPLIDYSNHVWNLGRGRNVFCEGKDPVECRTDRCVMGFKASTHSFDSAFLSTVWRTFA